jgi:hypothetical protein
MRIVIAIGGNAIALEGQRGTWEEQLAILGADPWRYGLRGNETVLQTLIRYAAEQGILANRATLEDLFVCIDEP